MINFSEDFEKFFLIEIEKFLIDKNSIWSIFYFRIGCSGRRIFSSRSFFSIFISWLTVCALKLRVRYHVFLLSANCIHDLCFIFYLKVIVLQEKYIHSKISLACFYSNIEKEKKWVVLVIYMHRWTFYFKVF